MKKIIITGGLGYIGTELCKIYSGEARYNKIIVIDNRFASKSVTQLNNWGIRYIEGDIRDNSLIKEVFKGVHLIYHLAGITEVPRTKHALSNPKDKLIKDVGENASKNIISLAPKTSKIIFPSTHVVFEGLEKVKYGIQEDALTKPVLTYSKGKVITEDDLINSNKNYTIVRLGTVYGYSNDMMRLNIMPNHFSKIAAQNGTIRLFAGGIQHKSLVSVFDAARCLKFLAESNQTNKEIFHCSNENHTIEEVAGICKKFQPRLKIIKTDEKIPNAGYTLSNKKLLQLGFQFKYCLEESIKEMIDKWSFNYQNNALELIQSGENEYIDERGKISNYNLTEPINLVGYIESKKGTVRANHYHPIQEQKCLLIKGKYISILKDLSEYNSVINTNIINEGDLSIIPPNVAHTMVFIEDSIFLNLVRGERDHENFGITHTIPYELVDDNLKKLFISYYKYSCRVCENNRLENIISLGMSPLANNLSKDKDLKVNTFPLEMKYCPKCYNSQLSFIVPPKQMFDQYLYVSSTNKTFRNHFNSLADKLINELSLNSNSLVIDIGSNDGVFLSPLKEKNINVLGIEPAINICAIARECGIETLNEYFDREIAKKILDTKGKADLVTAFNVFAHTDHIVDFTLGVFDILCDKGVFIIEVQYILDTIRDLTFDNIYHEHVNYWSVLSLDRFFSNLGYKIFKVEHVDTHGGSIRVFIANKNTFKIDSSVRKFISEEKRDGLNNFKFYQEFSKKIEYRKSIALDRINNLKKQNKLIVGYGSPAKATTLLNYYNITAEHLDYIIEDNELKHDYYLPGTGIKIRNKESALRNPPDYILVLAWNFFDSIKNNNKEMVESGSKFITFRELTW